MGEVISTFLFQPPDEPTPIARSKVFWLETRLGSRIPAFFINPFPGRFTILYSHGNAEDLGMLYDYLKELSRLLKINIMAYDYTGYGLAKIANEVEAWAFTPSEEHCYADIEAAYHHLTDVECIESATIILYGRSVGSGPSCYLAEKMFIGIESEKRCGGLILHSPFLSVCRVVVDLGFTFNSDMFPNVQRVKHLGCPVLVIHGTEDSVVPFQHGKQLYAELPRRYRAPPFWAKNLGHNDIELHQPRQFIKELRKFLNIVAKNPRVRKAVNVDKPSMMTQEESIFGPLSAAPKSKIARTSRPRVRQPEPIRYEGRSPSPERARSRGRSEGILKSKNPRDLRHGADDRLVPSPPPATKLIKVQVQKGNGRQGPVLGNGAAQRTNSPQGGQQITLSPPRSRSPVKVRTAKEKKRSEINLQQQMLHAKLSGSRSGSLSLSQSGSFSRR